LGLLSHIFIESPVRRRRTVDMRPIAKNENPPLGSLPLHIGGAR
jgi:hypothetical protein